MKTDEIEALESYTNTESEHWNGFAFNMLKEVLKQNEFENHETPLKLYSNAIELFIEHHEHPLKAYQLFIDELTEHNLTPKQQLFVCDWVLKYIKDTEFESFNLWEAWELLKSMKARLKAETQPDKPLTTNIRETLKELMQKELEQLPETLKGLEPVQRLNILCKLMPFVLPKVESVNHSQGEPNTWDKD